jgi:hypothetical protein
VAGDTFGYDFRAYQAAAARVLAGDPLYDTAAQVAGPYGLFLYPPPFALLVVPFGALPVETATWLWTALSLVAFAVAVALMPVRRNVRWAIVLLAGVSWPFLYAIKLGQVGPVLLLTFVAGWRWLDRPIPFGLAGALGAVIKIQPGLVLAWALLTRRWAAVAVGAMALLVLAAGATLVLGVPAWSDFLLLIGRVSDPITTPHNFTPGAVAWQAGIPRDAAAMVQWASMALALAAVVVAALRLSAPASYMVALVASQLLSPIVWDHYAVLLLVPVAWLLDRGHRWAALIPLATCVALVGFIPPVVYPVAFWATIAALFATGREPRPPASRRLVAAA